MVGRRGFSAHQVPILLKLIYHYYRVKFNNDQAALL